ncbi:DUF222 domain-containing protein [Cellulomonas sp. ATA003]|uniref:HNH endonuclease signature motif containing protein n=1 Tax=Cellulomonas sp. ATA003 TaxID=3073064 RepID=UPI0028731163|nr:DUF222 domain-containing protein [Cellulomonas sp. ATA003]WNB87166.1 DUF222 domain-containing protein [Cellulomonas sp. ATA003]
MDSDDVTPTPSGIARGFSPDLSALPADVAAAVGALLSATDALAAVDTTGLDGAQAAVIAAAAASVVSRLGVVGARMLPVVEADGLWALGGARSFPRWVAARHRVSVRTAHAQVRLGRALRDHLPATAAAGVAGAITHEQVQVIGTIAPTTLLRREVLADPGNECNEAFLVGQAKGWPVDSLRILTRRWAAAADPDADDRGYRDAADREHFTMSRTSDGYHLAGQLTIDNGQYLKAALEAITPVPAVGDDRTPARRRAQALGDLARVVLDRGLTGTRGAVRSHVSVLVPYSVITDAEAAAHAGAGAATAAATADSTRAGADGGQAEDSAGRGPEMSTAHSTDGTDGVVAPAGGEAPAQLSAYGAQTEQPEQAGHVEGAEATEGAEAAEAAEAAVHQPGSDDLFTAAAVSGVSPIGIPQYHDGTPVPRAALDRLMCDGAFTRFLFSADSQILDVGRERRLFTPHMRAAIIARDKHCAYPGCTAPPVLCETHHVDQWARDHGTTCVTNGILLCWYHHDLIHRMNITITRNKERWAFTDRFGAAIGGTTGWVSGTDPPDTVGRG